jgi:hypothetical protein
MNFCNSLITVAKLAGIVLDYYDDYHVHTQFSSCITPYTIPPASLPVLTKALPMTSWPWKSLPVRSGGRQALHHLGEITGEITTDDLLENIFSKFCLPAEGGYW